MRKLFLIFIMGALFSACQSSTEKQKTEALAVKVAIVERATFGSEQNYTFISQPYRSTDLSFRVNGVVHLFDAQPGKFYRKGEIIAQLDPRDFVLRRERAESIYSQAKAEMERVEVLYDKNNLSASAYEKAKAEYTSAKTAFQTAVNELNDTQLVAPFSGYVGEKYIEKHQDVKATQPIVSFEDLESLKIDAYVSQNIAVEAQSQKDARIVFDALPNKEFTVDIEQVSKSTTSNNLSYLVTAKLANHNAELLSGMSRKIYFNVENSSNNELVLPQSAICHRPKIGDYVWVIDSKKNTVERKNIKVGRIVDNGMISIEIGLKEGEMVAQSGHRFLSNGCKVQLNNH
ncbi:MAG: efflux RND transporter periplasmic adaptor subunit [Bacteroidaceae bacterium]